MTKEELSNCGYVETICRIGRRFFKGRFVCNLTEDGTCEFYTKEFNPPFGTATTIGELIELEKKAVEEHNRAILRSCKLLAESLDAGISLYVARDEGYYVYEDENDDDGIRMDGSLHIFYERPEYVGHTEYQRIDGFEKSNGYSISGYTYWTNARMIGEIPNSMYPEIKEGTCVKFFGIV